MASLAADAFVIDLEDGVSASEKPAARQRLLDGWPFGLPPEKAWLRVNGDDDGLAADLELIARLRPSWVVLPKVEQVERVAHVCRHVADWETRVGLMIETATGVTRVRELAAVAPQVSALIVGSADLARSMGARPDEERQWEHVLLSEIVLAARTHDLLAIDSVYFHFRDETGLERHATLARRLGYDAKSCIHPDQLATIHRVFSPTPDERRWAERVAEEWVRQDGDRAGVVVVDGEMIEALHLELAREILSRAETGDGSE